LQASFFERAKIHNTCIGLERKTGFFLAAFTQKKKEPTAQAVSPFRIDEKVV
jgi:hypothetical protein